ncbi:MAG: hypothetical protein J1E04_05860 [Alistipes sp.]|nr:hypothetical protein [Alistipes sp.]
MSPAVTVILIATAATGLFVLGLSLTLIFKGHDIDGDISTNRNMQQLGIKCPVREAREDTDGQNCGDFGCGGTCSSCDIKKPEEL